MICSSSWVATRVIKGVNSGLQNICPYRGTSIPLHSRHGPEGYAQGLSLRSCTTRIVQQNHFTTSQKLAHNHGQAMQTARDLEEFDTAENVFIVIAHDPSLLDEYVGVDFFPRILNGCKEKYVADKVRWSFLNDFVHAMKQGNEAGKL
jgi:hypothetical protein